MSDRVHTMVRPERRRTKRALVLLAVLVAAALLMLIVVPGSGFYRARVCACVQDALGIALAQPPWQHGLSSSPAFRERDDGYDLLSTGRRGDLKGALGQEVVSLARHLPSLRPTAASLVGLDEQDGERLREVISAVVTVGDRIEAALEEVALSDDPFTELNGVPVFQSSGLAMLDLLASGVILAEQARSEGQCEDAERYLLLGWRAVLRCADSADIDWQQLVLRRAVMLYLSSIADHSDTCGDGRRWAPRVRALLGERGYSDSGARAACMGQLAVHVELACANRYTNLAAGVPSWARELDGLHQSWRRRTDSPFTAIAVLLKLDDGLPDFLAELQGARLQQPASWPSAPLTSRATQPMEHYRNTAWCHLESVRATRLVAELFADCLEGAMPTSRAAGWGIRSRESRSGAKLPLLTVHAEPRCLEQWPIEVVFPCREHWPRIAPPTGAVPPG